MGENLTLLPSESKHDQYSVAGVEKGPRNSIIWQISSLNHDWELTNIYPNQIKKRGTMIIINHNNEEGGTSMRGVLPFIHRQFHSVIHLHDHHTKWAAWRFLINPRQEAWDSEMEIGSLKDTSASRYRTPKFLSLPRWPASATTPKIRDPHTEILPHARHHVCNRIPDFG